MSTLGLPELLIIIATLVLPCLGLLVVGGILAVVVLLSRKNREN